MTETPADSGPAPDPPSPPPPNPMLRWAGTAAGVLARGMLLLFACVWLGGVGTFFYFMGREFYRELRAAFLYRPVTATVTAYTPASVDAFDEEEAAACITYRYDVDGRPHEGKYSMPGGMRARDEYAARLAGPLTVGDPLPAWYDPDAPATSTLNPAAQPFFLGFFIFLMPFAAVGLMMVYGAVTARAEDLKPRAGRKAIPIALGGAFIPVYFVVSAASAFGFFFAAAAMEWRTGLGVGLTVWWLGAPLATLAVTRLLHGRGERRRRAAEAESPIPTYPGPVFDDGAPADAATPKAAPASARRLTSPPMAGTTAAPRPAAAPAKFLLLFAVFWCGITGVFVGILAVTVVRHLDAQRRFLTTEGVILASKVESHSDSDGTTYGAAVRYRYTVGGREYVGNRFDFGGWKSSEYDYWRDVVKRHPAGARVTVYYDPEDPAVSVLAVEIPPMMYFLALFLQPFILVGVGLVVSLAHTAVQGRRIRRFLEEPVRIPCVIPTWGELHEEMGALTVARRPSVIGPLLGFATGYGLTCFILVFVLAFGFGGFGTADPRAVKAAMAIAAAIGLAGMVLAVRQERGKAEFRAEAPHGALTLRGAKRDVEVRMADVAAWTVRKVTHPGAQSGQRTLAPLLAAVTRAGEEVPVHVFGTQGDTFALAEHVARGLGQLTLRPFQPAAPEGAEAGAAPPPARWTGTVDAEARPDLSSLVGSIRQAAAKGRSARKAATHDADLT